MEAEDISAITNVAMALLMALGLYLEYGRGPAVVTTDVAPKWNWKRHWPVIAMAILVLLHWVRPLVLIAIASRADPGVLATSPISGLAVYFTTPPYITSDDRGKTLIHQRVVIGNAGPRTGVFGWTVYLARNSDDSSPELLGCFPRTTKPFMVRLGPNATAPSSFVIPNDALIQQLTLKTLEEGEARWGWLVCESGLTVDAAKGGTFKLIVGDSKGLRVERSWTVTNNSLRAVEP